MQSMVTTKSAHLQKLWQPGCDFLGVSCALMGGAMTWVSERNLVSALSNAGGFGVLASGAMSPELLEQEIKATRALTKQPFGVNLIVMHPRLEDLITVCRNNQVTHVVFAGGIPQSHAITQVKDYNAKVICFAPSLLIAKKLIKTGADALIIEGMEAGGHIGAVSTSVLVQEILPFIREVPVFVAGGIGRGEAIVTYLEMGAAGCQLGTRFVCSEESVAHPEFKKAFIRSHARDAVTSVQIDPRFPVIPVRAIANSATRDFTQKQKDVIERYEQNLISLKDAQLEIEHFWAGALRKAVIDGDVVNGSVMAGQSVGMVHDIKPVKNILEELIEQAELVLQNRFNCEV